MGDLLTSLVERTLHPERALEPRLDPFVSFDIEEEQVVALAPARIGGRRQERGPLPAPPPSPPPAAAERTSAALAAPPPASLSADLPPAPPHPTIRVAPPPPVRAAAPAPVPTAGPTPAAVGVHAPEPPERMPATGGDPTPGDGARTTSPLPAPVLSVSAVEPAAPASGRDEPGERGIDPPATPAPPTVHITIGRLEVRAAAAPRPRPVDRRPPPTIASLDDYLDQRAKGHR